MSRRQQIKSKKITDVLSSNDLMQAQGFMFEGGDDCATVVYQDDDDEEMPGTGISWTVIWEEMGASEQLELRRSSRIRELYAEEEFDSEEEEFDNEDGLDGMDEDEWVIWNDGIFCYVYLCIAIIDVLSIYQLCCTVMLMSGL